MSVTKNAFAHLPENTTIIEEATTFVENVQFDDIPQEALYIGKRCIIDGLGLYVAGSEEHSLEILVAEAMEMGGREYANLLSTAQEVPAPRSVNEADIKTNEIEQVTVHAGTNILRPIRYPIASNHLQAKFSLPAALSMIALSRRAGKVEFSDEFVGSDAMQAMQRRVKTELDPEIEAQGFDKMRSRITITLTDGREISGWADERYRGGPENPLTDGEVEDKARSCCDGVLTHEQQDKLLATAWNVLGLEDAGKSMANVLNGAS